jgi:hypothetical protein
MLGKLAVFLYLGKYMYSGVSEAANYASLADNNSS